MKKTMEVFSKIGLKKLSEYKAYLCSLSESELEQQRWPKPIRDFCTTLQTEIKELVNSEKLEGGADELLPAIVKKLLEHNDTPDELSKKTEKLSLLLEIVHLLPEGGSQGLEKNAIVYSGTTLFGLISQQIPGLREVIPQQVSHMIQRLNQSDFSLKDMTKIFSDFGLFLKKEFSGYTTEEIRDILQKIYGQLSVELSPEFWKKLQAFSTVSADIVDEDKDGKLFLSAFTQGVAVFQAWHSSKPGNHFNLSPSQKEKAKKSIQVASHAYKNEIHQDKERKKAIGHIDDYFLRRLNIYKKKIQEIMKFESLDEVPDFVAKPKKYSFSAFTVQKSRELNRAVRNYKAVERLQKRFESISDSVENQSDNGNHSVEKAKIILEQQDAAIFSYYIRAISQSFNDSARKEEIIEICAEFGEFLQKRFPGKDIDFIRGKLESFKLKMPAIHLNHFDHYVALLEAKINLYSDIADNISEPDKFFMDALSKGLIVFGNINPAINKQNKVHNDNHDGFVSEKIVSTFEKNIYHLLPSVIQAQEEIAAQKILLAVEQSCITCKKHLESVIYSPDQDSLEFSELPVSSSNLRLETAKSSLDATNALLKITQDKSESNPVEKVKTLKRVYAQPEIKQALSTDPDPVVTRFFKKIGDFLSKIAISLGVKQVETETRHHMFSPKALSRVLRENLDVPKISHRPS